MAFNHTATRQEAMQGYEVMGIRENKVEKFLDREFKKRGGLTRKWKSPGVDGVPDRICMLNGEVWMVEVKTVDGVVSPAQRREHDRLTEVGMTVRTVYGNPGVSVLMREVDEC